MAKLTQEMKDMIAAQLCFYATVSKEGIPNIVPKGSTRILDDETLTFQEGFGGQTYQNILDGSKVAIAVVDSKVPDGYRFLGTPRVDTSGEIYDKAAAAAAKINRPKPLAVIVIHIDKIYSVKPNKNAGKQLE